MVDEERSTGHSLRPDDEVRTDGGAVIGGDVSVQEGGTLVGRDQIVYNVQARVGLYSFGSTEALDRFIRRGVGPYKYLSAYATEDAAIYFGREAAVDQMMSRLERRPHAVLCGQPGMGKSSLINAGLMPPLLRDGWLVLCVRGYGYPTAMLRLVLDVEQIEVPLEEMADLCALANATIESTGQPLAIIFDQFERFFSIPQTEQRRFVHEFARCASLDWHGRMRFLFSLRSDFLSALGSVFQDQVPDVLNDAYVLPPMTREEARRAILEPVIGRGMRYDLDFVDDVLLAHLDDEDRLRGTVYPPHLQIVCQTLYDAAREQQEPRITHLLYRSLGGTKQILGDYLEGELAKFSADERELLRAALKQMVSVHGTRVFCPVREIAAFLSRESDRVEGLLRRLVKARLLEVREEEGERRYSLSHEYMVTEIQSWFSEHEWNQRRAREVLARTWADWGATGRLLVEPRRLAWLRGVRGHLDLTPDQLSLLLRSAVQYERDPAYWMAEMAADEETRRAVASMVDGTGLAATASPVVKRAAQALGMLDGRERGPRALPEVAVAHPDGRVRHTAALGLAVLGGDEALKTLRPHLEGGIGPRWRALLALARMRVAGVRSPWPSLLAPPVEGLMAFGLRVWGGRVRLVSMAVGAGVGGALMMVVQSLLVVLLGLRDWRGAVFAYPTVGAILGGLSVGLLVAVQQALPEGGSVRRAVRDVVGLMAGFVLAQAAFVPLTVGQPLWSALASSALVGLGMGLAPAVQRASRRHHWADAAWGGGLAALGGVVGRTIGVLVAPVSLQSDALLLYLFPTLNATVVNRALRVWGLGDLVSLSVLAVVLQALTAGLLGAGITAGMAAGARLWRRVMEREDHDER